MATAALVSRFVATLTTQFESLRNELVRSAEEEAAIIIRDANRRAEEIINEAHTAAERITAEAITKITAEQRALQDQQRDFENAKRNFQNQVAMIEQALRSINRGGAVSTDNTTNNILYTYSSSNNNNSGCDKIVRNNYNVHPSAITITINSLEFSKTLSVDVHHASAEKVGYLNHQAEASSRSTATDNCRSNNNADITDPDAGSVHNNDNTLKTRDNTGPQDHEEQENEEDDDGDIIFKSPQPRANRNVLQQQQQQQTRVSLDSSVLLFSPSPSEHMQSRNHQEHDHDVYDDDDDNANGHDGDEYELSQDLLADGPQYFSVEPDLCFDANADVDAPPRLTLHLDDEDGDHHNHHRDTDGGDHHQHQHHSLKSECTKEEEAANTSGNSRTSLGFNDSIQDVSSESIIITNDFHASSWIHHMRTSSLTSIAAANHHRTTTTTTTRKPTVPSSNGNSNNNKTARRERQACLQFVKPPPTPTPTPLGNNQQTAMIPHTPLQGTNTNTNIKRLDSVGCTLPMHSGSPLLYNNKTRSRVGALVNKNAK